MSCTLNQVFDIHLVFKNIISDRLIILISLYCPLEISQLLLVVPLNVLLVLLRLNFRGFEQMKVFFFVFLNHYLHFLNYLI